MRTSQYSFGANEFTNMRVVPEYRVVEYTFEDLDAVAHTLKIPVEKDTMILEVMHLTETAFAGGTPALNVGDSTDADGFMALVEADINTANDLRRSQGFFTEDAGGVATKSAFAQGKFYATNDYILLTHAADLTAGKGKVLICEMSLKGNWRVPDL